VTAAALGVGTAVAVAGTSLASNSSTSADDADEGRTTVTARNNIRLPNQLRPIKDGGEEQVPVKVEFSPEIIHPEPLVIKSPGGGDDTTGSGSFDPQAINELTQNVQNLTRMFAAYNEEAVRLRNEVDSKLESRVRSEVNTAKTDIKNDLLNLQQPKFEALNNSLAQSNLFNRWETFGLRDRMNAFDTNFGTTLKNVSEELASTRNTLENLERGQNSGGRNLATRTKQLFLSGNTYMATNQAVVTLRRLMCTPDKPCAVVECKPGDKPNELCSGKAAEREIAAAKQRILSALEGRIGLPPTKDDRFLQALRDKLSDKDEAVLAEWKPILLKYTRVAY
jgi:hypothetical protein